MPLFFIIESGIFVLHRKRGRQDTPANAENGLCRTQYVDEPRFRCFSIAPLSPRQQKWDNSWRNSSEGKRVFCRGDHRSPAFRKRNFRFASVAFLRGWTGDQWSPLRESVCFSYPVFVWRSFRLSEVHETGAQRNTNPVGATTGRPLLRSVLRWRQTRQKTLPYGSRGTMRSGIGVTEGGRRRTNIRGGVA